MCYITVKITCPQCGNPDARAAFWASTEEEVIVCYVCGYSKSNTLIDEFWDLDGKYQTLDKLSDGKWRNVEEQFPIGVAGIHFKSFKIGIYSFTTKEQIEKFKEELKSVLKDIEWGFMPGQNILREFRNNIIYATDLKTMTMQEYTVQDYCEKFFFHSTRNYTFRNEYPEQDRFGYNLDYIYQSWMYKATEHSEMLKNTEIGRRPTADLVDDYFKKNRIEDDY